MIKWNNPFGLPGPDPRPFDQPHRSPRQDGIGSPLSYPPFGNQNLHDSWGLNPPEPWPKPGGDPKSQFDMGGHGFGSMNHWTKF